jgi:hypothetical protein
MGDYLKRVIEEKAELDEKRERLTQFISSPMFKKLPTEECNRLRLQQITMSNYSVILDDRIRASPLTGESPFEREVAGLRGEVAGLRARIVPLWDEMGKIKEASADLHRRMESLLRRLSGGDG